MEQDAPPPEPTAPPQRADDAAAPAESSAPMLSTPVIVAMLSLSGVLGGALFSNWDKIFGHPAKPAATAPATATTSGDPRQPSLSALQGLWLSPIAQHPYQPDRRFRLRLALSTAGGELGGQVSDVAADSGGRNGPAQEIQSPRAVADGLDFQTASTWCCEGGKEQPYQTFYQLRPTSQGLAVTRRNNAPGGGQVERFLLSRE